MENSTETKQENNEVTFLEEGNSFEENLLRALIISYEQNYNKANEKQEINYELTVTTHKVATPDGNKDVAYLRLVRGIRPKGGSDEEWSTMLVHQEHYVFKNIKEQLSPRWREQLYMNCLARVFAGGLEYAELLRKMKMIEDGKKAAGVTNEEEQRLNNIGLVSANQMPAPLTKADEEYKAWLAKERAKEGL